MTIGQIAYNAAANLSSCQQPWEEANQDKWEVAAIEVYKVAIAMAVARISCTVALQNESSEKLKEVIKQRVADLGKESHLMQMIGKSTDALTSPKPAQPDQWNAAIEAAASVVRSKPSQRIVWFKEPCITLIESAEEDILALRKGA